MIDILNRFLALPPIQSSPLCLLRSQLAPAAPDDEIAAAWGAGVPDEVAGCWRAAREARLHADLEYGQWGLHVMSPQDSHARTLVERQRNPGRYREGDVVLGEFLGDQQLLVVAPSESAQRRVLVALPLDPREEWYGVAPDLRGFLERFLAAAGDKYWESAASGDPGATR